VLTTDGARLMTSMHQHLRLSGRFAYAVLAGYRLLEQLPQTWATIRAAQAVRDPWRRGRGPSAAPRALGRAAFTLLVTSLRGWAPGGARSPLPRTSPGPICG